LDGIFNCAATRPQAAPGRPGLAPATRCQPNTTASAVLRDNDKLDAPNPRPGKDEPMQRPAGGMPSSTLLSRLRSIMEGGTPATAHERYRYLLGMLRTTRPAEIYSLLAAPEELRLASAYLHAVLDDLDEVRPSAAAELHSVLGSAVGSILVGWPE
jgi:hypothetical protein